MEKKRYPVYLASLFLGFHYYLIIYINSNFLSPHLNDGQINILYTLGAVFSVLFLFLIPKILNVLSAKTLLLSIVFLEFISVLGLGIVKFPAMIIVLFVAYQSLGVLLVYCLDLFLENSMTDEKNTGFARALFLTAISTTLIISFLIVSMLASYSLSIMYILSAAALLPFALLVLFKFNKEIHKNKVFKLKDIFHFLSKDLDVLRILIINFILQLFYAIMIIYLPLMLYKNALFGWGEIGKILAIMILPFILFEMPLGKLFDKKTGEKEALIIGVIVLSVFTALLSTIKSAPGEVSSFWLWTSILFATRIGASFIEIGSESYFFKKVTDRHSGVISLFRMTGPLAYIISPLIAIPALYFTSYSGLFGVLSLITLSGLLFIPKVDTK